ncbi:ribosomal RNA-processing protein 8 [Solea solea]|uniref:ribosomal RNA-processing protein 8 n=1 Tax=Solea solea TaxID=90069 RepID=UPI00272AF2A0|nr:ribosomal RNA-processing protein 8 [Solea solea]
MFNEEEDWSDEEEAQNLSKSVFTKTQKTNKSTDGKVIGKKSLLRTLQTLGSVPEWKSENQEQQDSDSETEAAPAHPKKKKKRRKNRKRGKTSEEQQENGDVEQKEKPAAKKGNTFLAKKLKPTSAGTTMAEGVTTSAKANLNEAENADNLSRQQWKNKMKNKRNCKNKYRQNDPEVGENKTQPVEKQKLEKDMKTESPGNKKSQKAAPKKKIEMTSKAQKRKKSEEDTDISSAPQIQTLKEEKQSTKAKKDCENTTIPDDQQQLPMKKLKPELSKDQIMKREKLRKMLQRKDTKQKEISVEQKDEPLVPAEPAAEVKLDRSASLRSRMEQRLDSARFRYINELLYSTNSGEAKRMFSQDPQAFRVYHRGYTAQVQRWPSNPVDAIISYILQKPSSLVVADFGCGDCKIARSVPNKVHSFDLASTCELVTVCDMANVPLADRSVDIAVFCLSLMGTNLEDFLAEANRVLKMRGVLKIAEVASRFENVRSFITGLANLGFKMVSKDTENTHFYSFEFEKIGNSPENIKKFGLELRACVYKKR